MLRSESAQDARRVFEGRPYINTATSFDGVSPTPLRMLASTLLCNMLLTHTLMGRIGQGIRKPREKFLSRLFFVHASFKGSPQTPGSTDSRPPRAPRAAGAPPSAARSILNRESRSRNIGHLLAAPRRRSSPR